MRAEIVEAGRRSLAAAAAVAAAVLLASSAGAQEWSGQNISAEGRIGVTFPVGDLSDRGGESGLAITGDLFYNFHPNWSGYAGWEYHNFNCDGCPDDLESSGPHAGAKYLFNWAGAALPWVRGGLVYAKAEDFQGGTDVESDRNIGVEIATGIDWALTPRISLVPSLWLTRYSAVLPEEDLTMTYFVLDVGAHYHF